jgi:hypothetical protein
MKLSDLVEMAMRGGNLTARADAWAAKLEISVLHNLNDHPIIGAIGDLVVRKKFLTVTVWSGEKMVLAAKVDPVPGAYCMIDDIWTALELRGQKLFSKFLLFLKIDQGYTKLAFAELHSDDTYDLLKAGGLKAFKKHWENYHGEVADFSPNTIDEFYGAGHWKLILENTADMSYLIREDGFTHTYEALAHAVNVHEHDDF